jgi:hypothetical protein
VADPFHQQCVDATVAILTALNLEGIGGRVLSQLLEQEAGHDLPAVLVTTEGEPIPAGRFTTGSRLVDYPVRVKFADRQAAPGGERLPRWAAWNDAVLDAFPDRKRAEYPAGVIGCRAVNRASVKSLPGVYQLAEGEWLLLFRAVRKAT